MSENIALIKKGNFVNIYDESHYDFYICTACGSASIPALSDIKFCPACGIKLEFEEE